MHSEGNAIALSIAIFAGLIHFSACSRAPKPRPEWETSSNRKIELPWVRRSNTNKGVIVFVHGVTGNAHETWANGKVYWPALLTTDRAFDGQNVYVYSYPSPRVKQTLSVDEVAENLRLVLTSDGVLHHDQLTFVSHSMGGLVTRAFLVKYQRDILGKIRLLFFFGTPTTGSPYASLAGLLSNNPQITQMYPMNSDNYVATLQSNWLAARLNIRSYCAYERETLAGLIIVDRQSATNLCTERLDPIDGNHITMVKPASETSTAYRALKAAFVETALPARPAGPARPLAQPGSESVAERSAGSGPSGVPIRVAGTALPQRVVMDYEDLSSRLDAVEKSLRERMRDLNGAQPKPEVLADLRTCRQDLTAAKVAMEAGNLDAVGGRLDRARRTIARLESL